MTVISVLIVKTDETDQWVKYSFGNPPRRILGEVKVNKANGNFEILNIEHDKYKKVILPCVIRKISEHYETGEFPDKTSYHA